MSELKIGDTPRFPSTLAPPPYYQGLTERITENLLPVFSKLFDLQTTSRILELASGNGLHSLVYSKAFPKLTIQPTECDSFNMKRIDETCEKLRSNEARDGGVKEAVELDVMKEEDWERIETNCETIIEGGKGEYDLVIGHNFLHMIPFPEGPKAIFHNLSIHKLISSSHGLVAFYGPFKHDEGFYSEGDCSFDKEISARPSSYPLGLRSIDALARIAQEEGFEFVEKVPMPKGNFVLIYKVQGAQYPDLKWE
ncbi:hypothetical protein JCM3765_003598 [Sporobolomyces pararoseus]